MRNIASKLEESSRKRRDSMRLIPTNLCACLLTRIMPSKFTSLSTTYRLIETTILQDYHSLSKLHRYIIIALSYHIAHPHITWCTLLCSVLFISNSTLILHRTPISYRSIIPLGWSIKSPFRCIYVSWKSAVKNRLANIFINNRWKQNIALDLNVSYLVY